MGTSESAGGAGGCESVSFRLASDGEGFERSASGDGEGSRGEGTDRETRRASSRARAEDSAVKPGRIGTRAVRTSYAVVPASGRGEFGGGRICRGPPCSAC